MIKLIKTKKEHAAAIARISDLMDADPAPGSAEENELELLALLAETYEKESIKRQLPDPIEAIRFRMDQQGLTNKDLEPIIGSKSKVSEILNRKRSLSLSMIRRLNYSLGIATEVLLQDTTSKLVAENQGPYNQKSNTSSNR